MLYQIKSFFSFYFRAVTKYNVQSPFLFDFVNNVLDTTKEYYFFDTIEKARKVLLSSKQIIDVVDYGAGSKSNMTKKRKISDIAHSSLSNTTKCRIIFNIINHYNALQILELGTSLGISSAYMAAANRAAKVTTLEGDTMVAMSALATHKSLNINNINLVQGPFQDTLLPVLATLGSLDAVFMDGHHLKDPTMTYFDQLKPYCHQNTIIIVDDIYWSKDMNEAWELLKKDPMVSLSVDLFDIGILFFNLDLSKQDVSYISYRYKPWKIGLFG